MDSRKIITEYRLNYWSQFIRDCKDSGLSIKAFCDRAGVLTNTYYYWQKKLRDEACQQLVAMTSQKQSDSSQYLPAPQGFAEVRIKEGDILPAISEAAGIGAASIEPYTPSQLVQAMPQPIQAAPPSSQIHIKTAGFQISVDQSYPIDRLTELLKGLTQS